jgi:quercetin dioxygenase-like cupin family protein
MPGAHIPFDKDAFSWRGVGPRAYRETVREEKGMGFRGVARHTLARGEELPAEFELRYFELDPGGYSSLEKHRHAHFVIALRGSGRALIGEQVIDLQPLDAVYVAPDTPHRWMNRGDEPFGFLCPVDASRDRPQPLDDAEWEALRANPVTAPYVF